MLSVAARPADDEHAFGHSKAEYASSGVEGTLILVAAGMIAVTAIRRLLNPEPLEQVGVGMAVSPVASLINLGAAWIIGRAGKRHAPSTCRPTAST
jgi:divalent metal cation (Fe/Co/Zn/Cd) transporter